MSQLAHRQLVGNYHMTLSDLEMASYLSPTTGATSPEPDKNFHPSLWSTVFSLLPQCLIFKSHLSSRIRPSHRPFLMVHNYKMEQPT